MSSDEDEPPPFILYNEQPITKDSESDDEVPPSLYIEMNPLLQDPDPLPQQPIALSHKDVAFQSMLGTTNLDLYLQRVYQYYVGKGLFAILLSRITNLIVLMFIVSFAMFLLYCVDHASIKNQQRLSDVIVPQCISKLPWFPTLFGWVFFIWWLWQLSRVILDYPQLVEIQEFYNYGLDVQDSDLNTISWSQVVHQIVKLRNTTPVMDNPAVDQIDAHNIANRIMRKDNYFIAIINKGLLDLSIQPIFGQRQFLTLIMEWNVWFVIVSFVFDQQGAVKSAFLKDTNRTQLAEGLQKRFKLMAIINLIFAPFLLAIFLLYFFFRYAEEYHKDPSSIAARKYSPLAWWQFREFNELPHLYQARLTKSHPKAYKYLSQFRKEPIIILSRFLAFISGSFAIVLAILTVVDQGLLTSFEITPGASVLFYIGIFGTTFAACRSFVPEEHMATSDPEALLKQIIEDIHYFPEEWRGMLNTEQVRNQFSSKFQYKIVLFLLELFSLIAAPVMLWFTIPNSSQQLVDFFREFSVHVDALGYVCSFAVFDFKRHGKTGHGEPSKMEQSFIHFKVTNPEWEPEQEASKYFQQVVHRKGKEPLTESIMNQTDVGWGFYELMEAVYEHRGRIG